jgi:hypothetical protein
MQHAGTKRAMLLPAAAMPAGTLCACDMPACATLVPHCVDPLPADMRDMMQWLVAAQEPDSQEYRAAGVTRKHRYVSGGWQLVQERTGTAAETEAAVEAAATAAVL